MKDIISVRTDSRHVADAVEKGIRQRRALTAPF